MVSTKPWISVDRIIIIPLFVFTLQLDCPILSRHNCYDPEGFFGQTRFSALYDISKEID